MVNSAVAHRDINSYPNSYTQQVPNYYNPLRFLTILTHSGS